MLTPEVWQSVVNTLSISKIGETDFNALNASIIASGPDTGFRGPGKECTVDRTVLRSILAEGMKDDTSHGKELKSYTTTETSVVVEVKDGNTEEETPTISIINW